MPTLTSTELELKVLAPVAFMDDTDPATDDADADEDAEDIDLDEDEDEDEEDEDEDVDAA